MAYARIDFLQPHTGQMRAAPVGFSWTTLFFGFFPALLRGHWIGAIVQFLLMSVTAGLSWLVFPFIYNKMYVKHLLGEGYRMDSATHNPDYLSDRLGMPLPIA